MTRLHLKRPGTCALLFGLAAGGIYLFMLRVTLAHIAAVSGGLPLDMRPFGYDLQDVTDLFGALGAGGRHYYLTRQLPLDILYPALLALTLISVLCWLDMRLSARKSVRAGFVLAIGAAVLDYAENLGIAMMLLQWPDIPASLVFATRSATIAKSLVTTLAVLLTCWCAMVWVFARHLKARCRLFRACRVHPHSRGPLYPFDFACRKAEKCTPFFSDML